MAHAHSNSKNNKATASINAGADIEVKPATFHDFLGDKGQPQEAAPPAVGCGRPPLEVSPEATSDLGSERNVTNHLEGIPFYGSRGDVAGPDASNRLTGSKRNYSDSLLLLSRDKFPQGPTDSQDSQLLTKLLRYSGGERLKRPHDEETSFGMHQPMPISAYFISQNYTGGRTDNYPSKWDRATAVNPGLTLQYPPRTGQVMPFGYHSQSNRFKEMNAGPSLMSQTAADEGSRTGIKGSGVLNSINASGAIRRQPAGVLIRSGKQKSSTSIDEPESSTTPSGFGTESSGRQMTIFYGGQAHVFDNVHTDKADVIMALAGSNGGSWSTTYAPNSSIRPSTGENCVTSINNDVTSITMLRELHGGPSNKGDTHRHFASND